nr:membrane protein insertase YidC [Chitinophagaceae bacterium]
MDKNSFLGFGLLMLLLVGYIVYNQQGQPAKFAAEKKISDSIAAIQKKQITAKTNSDSISKTTPNASLDSTALSIPAQEFVLENDDVAITFSNKGAIPTKVWLKKYKTFTQKPLILFEGEKNRIDVVFQQAGGGKINSMNTSFNAKLDAENKKLNFYTTETNSPISFSYKLPKTGYLLEMNINTPNLDKSQNVTLNWTGQSLHTEQDIENEQMNSQVCYMLEKEGYDYYTIRDEKEMKLDEAVKWVSFKRHFFNSTLMTKEKFIISGKINSVPNHDSSAEHISDFSSSFILTPKETYAFNYYLGPNDYDVLKSAGTGLEEIIPLSYAWLGFVKYINKWLIIPIFNFLSSIFNNYGIVILLLTFIIRLLMSPFTYKSYVSGAKMKALKPELDELKEKYKDNQQEFGVEQMKLYRQAGVNPLGGCLPALL